MHQRGPGREGSNHPFETRRAADGGSGEIEEEIRRSWHGISRWALRGLCRSNLPVAIPTPVHKSIAPIASSPSSAVARHAIIAVPRSLPTTLETLVLAEIATEGGELALTFYTPTRHDMAVSRGGPNAGTNSQALF